MPATVREYRDTEREMNRQDDARSQLLDRAAHEMGDVRLEELAPNVGGMNKIGGGEQAMVLNRLSFDRLQTEEDLQRLMRTYEHEKAHGEAKELRGALILPKLQRLGAQRVQKLLQEGYAEVVGAEETGQAMTFHREDQPEEVYGEGQDLLLELIEATSRERVEELMTGDGDITRIQQEILQDGHRQEAPVALAA